MTEQRSDDPNIQRIIDDLALRKRSQPTASAMRSYRQLFEHVQQGSNSSIGQWWKTIVASLSWDSRQQGLAAGARRVATPDQFAQRAEYRLLYVTDAIEVEMMVLPNPSTCHIEGDIVSLVQADTPETNMVTPAWISLQDGEMGSYVVESQSDTEGRFTLPEVQLGNYTMQIILKDGTLVELSELQLT